MGLRFVDPPNGPPPAASYRHLAVVPSGSRLLVLAGQIGNLSDGTIVEGLEAQYEQALININAIVASEGGTPEDVARITVFLVERPERPFALEIDKKHFPLDHLPRAGFTLQDYSGPTLKWKLKLSLRFHSQSSHMGLWATK
tara:strand:+ start:210 stop:635 length:426 start_codon:yes stop_codon:yes gene_type:complete